MARADGPDDVLAARTDVLTVGERFAAAAGPILGTAIRRRLEAVIAGRAADLPGPARAALLEAAGRAIGTGVENAVRRLDDPDVWLSPHVRLDPAGRARSTDGRRRRTLAETLAGHPRAGSVGELANPENRAWIAMLGAAKATDPVLEEFGFRPSPAPDPGGGHFGLQPRTLTELDPSGLLASLWREYREALGRYEGLLEAAAPEG